MRKTWWLAVMASLVLGMFIAPARCSAEAKCPWLNAATAAGVLGGDVEMAVTAPVEPSAGKGVGTAMYPDQVRMDRFDVSCEFRRKVDSGVDKLSIAVKTMSDPAKEFASFLALCGGPAIALKGIGNEAVQCVIESKLPVMQEKVIARVRDRAFVLTIDRARKTPDPKAMTEISSDTLNMAEQVAGSLF